MSDPHMSAPPSAEDLSKAGRIGRIIIVGNDEALWLTANALWLSFNRTGREIVAVELPSQLRSSDVIPTHRNQQAFHDLMRIPEGVLMAATQGTFSLGRRFANFSKTLPPFISGFGSYGRPHNRVPFVQYWVKARADGLNVPYDEFSLNAMAARYGRFFVPTSETDSFAECDYAYHLSSTDYYDVLKQIAVQRGVKHLETRLLNGVARDPDNGFIRSVSLSNGQTVEGDLFIDATGAKSLLLGEVMGVEFESWKQWFPFDRLLTASGPVMNPLPAVSLVSAFRSGWVESFPLRDRTAVQQAYASFDLNEQEALENAARTASMRFRPEFVVRPYMPGRRQSAWVGNCIGIGEAAAVFDPIDGVGTQSIMAGLAHLTSLIPLDRNMETERAEYNRNVTPTFERIRDYQICHYKLNQRLGDPLWDQCRDAALPDALAYKLEVFKARGHLVQYDDESFLDHDWQPMLIGHGFIPRAHDPVIDQMPEGEFINYFQQILGFIKTRVDTMKPMEAYFTHQPPAPAV